MITRGGVVAAGVNEQTRQDVRTLMFQGVAQLPEGGETLLSEHPDEGVAPEVGVSVTVDSLLFVDREHTLLHQQPYDLGGLEFA